MDVPIALAYDEPELAQMTERYKWLFWEYRIFFQFLLVVGRESIVVGKNLNIPYPGEHLNKDQRKDLSVDPIVEVLDLVG